MSDSKKKIGFIGLGIMGKPMCRNVKKAGYEVVVFNRSKESVRELAAEGAIAAASVAEVASQCEVIITMLPNSPEVREVCLENGIADFLEKYSGKEPEELLEHRYQRFRKM